MSHRGSKWGNKTQYMLEIRKENRRRSIWGIGTKKGNNRIFRGLICMDGDNEKEKYRTFQNHGEPTTHYQCHKSHDQLPNCSSKILPKLIQSLCLNNHICHKSSMFQLNRGRS